MCTDIYCRTPFFYGSSGLSVYCTPSELCRRGHPVIFVLVTVHVGIIRR